MTWTPRQYANEIKALTALIHESGITPILFKAAALRDESEMELFVEQLREKHAKLWMRMEALYTRYEQDEYPNVFYDGCSNFYKQEGKKTQSKRDDALVDFPEVEDILSFIILLALSETRMSEEDLFEGWIDLSLILQKEGREDLAEFSVEHIMCDTITLVNLAHINN